MKNVSRLLPLLPGIALLTGCNQKVQKDNGQNSQKPNIIYIFADDLGIGDLSCNFRHQYPFPLRTPDRYVPVATGEHRHRPRKLGTNHRHRLRHHGRYAERSRLRHRSCRQMASWTRSERRHRLQRPHHPQ